MGRNLLLIVALVCGLGFAVELGLMIANPPPPVADAPRQGYTIAWLLWISFAVLSFAVIEGIALVNDTGGDTLTEHIQWIAGKSPVWAGVVGVGIAAFSAWFLSHLFGRDSRVWGYLTERIPAVPEETEEPPEPDEG